MKWEVTWDCKLWTKNMKIDDFPSEHMFVTTRKKRVLPVLMSTPVFSERESEDQSHDPDISKNTSSFQLSSKSIFIYAHWLPYGRTAG